MKKNLYIHIGPPKTGTSVIQFWLNKNSDWLRSQGIYYPVHDVDTNNVSSGHRSIFLEKRENTTRTHFNHEKFRVLLSEFEATECSALLLSSEFFFYQVPEFVNYRDDYAIGFIAYVRADVELIESLYNQSVKRNHQVLPLAVRSTLPNSYLDDLEVFISTYSEASFYLRAYGNSNVFDTNITDDLLAAIGVKGYPHDLLQSTIINSSYSFECLEFKRWLNQFDLSDVDAQIDLCLQAYPGNNKTYSLLPANIYNGYLNQSLEKINRLHTLSPIHNYERLICYLSSKERGQYIHQDLYPSHLEKVVRYLAVYELPLLEIITSRIAAVANKTSDLERLKILQSAILQQTDTLKKAGWYKRLRNWLRK